MRSNDNARLNGEKAMQNRDASAQKMRRRGSGMNLFAGRTGNLDVGRRAGWVHPLLQMALWVWVVTLMAGCVTTGPVKKALDATAPAAKASKTGGNQLQDGRDGFLIQEVTRMDGNDRKAFAQAVALLNESKWEAAVTLLEAIVAKEPGITAPYINLGIAYGRLDKKEQAEAQFKKALAVFPGHPVACNECGLLYRRMGRFEEARQMYELALSGYPNYYPVHRNLGILYDLYLNRLDRAMVHYQTYSRAIPKDNKVKLWIADLQARLGKQ